jgi:hypothetical protein
MRPGALAAAGIVVLVASADAEPLRLRADALGSTRSPAGLLVLDADGALRAGMSAEAVVWMAGNSELDDGASGDVLVIAVHARAGRASAELGRFVSTLGALRPVHVDGGAVALKLPARFDLEAVAGVPVTPGFDQMASRSWDWVVGARASRRLGDWGSAGVAYGQRRDAGQLVSEELGLDAGATFGKQADAGARLAYDVANPGLAELALTSSYRAGALRTELYGVHRAASHLLPANSLFTVLGDVPSQRAGTVITWRAAPRLDVIADVAARYVDPDIGAELVGRARLRLDDKGTSLVSGELRRSGVGDDAWTGARLAARIALPRALVASSELELVMPDRDRGRGVVWPWGLVALAHERGAWQAAVAVEASASAEYAHRVDVLGTVSRRWGAP